jgi:superfamily II DNA or RNA helicase
MLRDFPFKQVYRSDTDHILRDFYVPALTESVSYDRAVGYFSASMLSYAAQGLSAFVENDGQIRLIVGGELALADFQALVEGYEMREVIEKLGESFVEIIEGVDDQIYNRRLELLSWLVACGRLDLKVALKAQGMYHEKIGIFTDRDGDKIVFQGSANETRNALLPDFNFESITVFPGWNVELQSYCEPFITGFDNLWENRTPNTVTIDFPEAARSKLISIAKRTTKILKPSIELELGQRSQPSPGEHEPSNPEIPTALFGQEFELKRHQRAALEAWRANGLTGVMALATGAGKTITSIYGAVKIFESEQRLFLCVAVPYQSLADQWVAVLRTFNIYPISCYMSSTNWVNELSEAISFYQTGATDFVCLVVVNRTLQSERFQNLIQQVPGSHMLWIGDECHHHGSVGLNSMLPKQAAMRLGLSATPEHYFNDEATDRILNYYGQIVARYSLAEALEEGVLTPYKYYVRLVELTPEETEEYQALSEQISRIAAISQNADKSDENDSLKILLFRRSRLIGKARNKFKELRTLLQNGVPKPLTLFYCGEGNTEDEDSGDTSRQVELTTSILRDLNWKSSLFTSQEGTRDRMELLDCFRVGLIDALVAMRCLDEGIDIPACRTAYILASSRNPKQFIQRRGRILRRSPGKEFAEIYDFVVVLPDESIVDPAYERKLIRSELERVAEFAKLSLNHAESIRVLSPVLAKYGLSHLIA